MKCRVCNRHVEQENLKYTIDSMGNVICDDCRGRIDWEEDLDLVCY
jgi:hypothetical protein